MKILASFILVFLLYTGGFAQRLAYDSLINKLNELSKANNYDEAHNNLVSKMTDYPEQWFELSKELIYLNKKTGRIKDNLSIFEEAHQKGYFYFIHPRMREYRDYLKYEEFESISKYDLELMNQSNKISNARFEVQLPESYAINECKKYPLAIFLHGGGKNLEDVKKHWNSDWINDQFIKVYLQSYRHFDSKTYGWGTQDEKMDNELKQIYRQIKNWYKVDTTAVILCSISAGATAALDMAFRSVIPVAGVLAICPSIPRFIRNKDFKNFLNLDLKVQIVAGENDHFLERQIEMIEVFKEFGIKYQHLVIDGMGHQYPVNEEKYFKEFINGLTINH